jgi:phage gp37-like protein
MTYTVETRYCGPTDYKGARIIATTGDGIRHVIPYPGELSGEAAHRKAVDELAAILGWRGFRVVGAPNKRGGFNFVLYREESR